MICVQYMGIVTGVGSLYMDIVTQIILVYNMHVYRSGLYISDVTTGVYVVYTYINWCCN